MRKLDHCNIVRLRYFFYSSGEKKDELYLNLVLEYVPETVYRVARHFTKAKLSIPIIYVKVGRQAAGPSCFCGFPHSPSLCCLWRPCVPYPCPHTPRDGARQIQGRPTQGLTESGRQAYWAGEAARCVGPYWEPSGRIGSELGDADRIQRGRC